VSKRASHKQALVQLVDRYVHDITVRGQPLRKERLVDEILRISDRFNNNPSHDEALRGAVDAEMAQVRYPQPQPPTFEVSITHHGDARPFWSKIVSTRADADRIAAKNQRLIDRRKWEHTVTIKEVP
jgi:hypothetical protein